MIKNFITRFEVWVFIVALIICNALMVTAKVHGVFTQRLNNVTQFGLLLFLLVGVVFFLRGKKGLFEIVKPLLEWRRPAWMYVFAICWTSFICLLVLTAQGIVNGEFISFEALKPGLAKISNIKFIITLAIGSLIGEMVWISYTLRKLNNRFTPFVSSLMVGFVWTLWWLPMAIHNYNIIPNLPIAALLINQTGVAAMCAFVYYHTRSGVLILVMQICFNATILAFPVIPTPQSNATYWIFAITYLYGAIALFMRFGPTPLLGDVKVPAIWVNPLMSKCVKDDVYS